MSFQFRSWVACLSTLALFLAGSDTTLSEENQCPEPESGLSLPNGFCATIFADKIGHARQLVVAPDGTVYVNTWSGIYYGNDTPPAGGLMIALKDTTGTGIVDVKLRIGENSAVCVHGGY